MTNADFVLHFGAAWLVVIVCARFVGMIARMVGQSAVIGEMISGILLANSLTDLVSETFLHLETMGEDVDDTWDF